MSIISLANWVSTAKQNLQIHQSQPTNPDLPCSLFQVGSSGHCPWRVHFKMVTLSFLFLKERLTPASSTSSSLAHLPPLYPHEWQDILEHLWNLCRGHYLRGLSFILCLNLNKGEVLYGNDQHLGETWGKAHLAWARRFTQPWFLRAAFSTRDDNTECGHHWTPLGRDERLQGVDFTVLLPGNYLGWVPPWSKSRAHWLLCTQNAPSWWRLLPCCVGSTGASAWHGTRSVQSHSLSLPTVLTGSWTI